MVRSTIEHAYALARSGRVSDVAALKVRLKSEGCRAVDTLLAQRAMQAHLQAICSASVAASQLQVSQPLVSDPPSIGDANAHRLIPLA